MSFISYLALCITLITACCMDVKNHAIPDSLTYAGTAAGFILSFFNTAVTPVKALSGFVACGVIFWLVLLLTKGGVGMGDVKLVACTGMFLGLEQAVSALLLATALSGLAGLILLAARASKPRGFMPFSPFVLIGAVLTIGQALL